MLTVLRLLKFNVNSFYLLDSKTESGSSNFNSKDEVSKLSLKSDAKDSDVSTKKLSLSKSFNSDKILKQALMNIESAILQGSEGKNRMSDSNQNQYHNSIVDSKAEDRSKTKLTSFSKNNNSRSESGTSKSSSENKTTLGSQSKFQSNSQAPHSSVKNQSDVKKSSFLSDKKQKPIKKQKKKISKSSSKNEPNFASMFLGNHEPEYTENDILERDLDIDDSDTVIYGRSISLTSGIDYDLNQLNNSDNNFFKSTGKTRKSKMLIHNKDIVVEIKVDLSIDDLAKKMCVKKKLINKWIKDFKFDIKDNILDADTAQLLVEAVGNKVVRVKDLSPFDLHMQKLTNKRSKIKQSKRPPIVTIMGHVDHGKTSILDYLRKTNVTSQESGGITQHIGAYSYVKESKDRDRMITFLDTPGHAAFQNIRSRGSSITDIVVLVVAPNDGVMPQTLESINLCLNLDVNVIIALNKMDLVESQRNCEKVIGEIANKGLCAESLGGLVPVVKISAKTGDGISNLLDKILEISDIFEYESYEENDADGYILESKIDPKRGILSTLLVKNGTLNVGDIVISGTSIGRVRLMTDSYFRKLNSAGPSVSAEVAGFSSLPKAGDVFVVVDSEKEGREIIRFNESKSDSEKIKLINSKKEEKSIVEQEVKRLKILVKADTQGSLEGLENIINSLEKDNFKIDIIYKGIGDICNKDLDLACSTNDVSVIGFNVKCSKGLKEEFLNLGITLKLHSVIYDVNTSIADIAKSKIPPEDYYEPIGKLIFKKLFDISKVGLVYGCKVLTGSVEKGLYVKHKGLEKMFKIISLKKEKDMIKKAVAGQECGFSISTNECIEFEEDEVFEVFEKKLKYFEI